MALVLPRTKDVLELVELLIGEKPIFAKGTGWNLAKPAGGCYITFLQARDKTVEGAVVTNLPATLYIGGKLILRPESTLVEQSYEGCADEPIIEAVTEVVNNMRTLFNNISVNPHVAPTRTFDYKVPVSDDYVGWLLEPGRRDDYVGETKYGMATLTLLSR